MILRLSQGAGPPGACLSSSLNGSYSAGCESVPGHVQPSPANSIEPVNWGRPAVTDYGVAVVKMQGGLDWGTMARMIACSGLSLITAPSRSAPRQEVLVTSRGMKPFG